VEHIVVADADHSDAEGIEHGVPSLVVMLL